MKASFRILTLLILLVSNMLCTDAKVHVHVINRLGDNKPMNIHCRSNEDDLGYQRVEDGSETTWNFSVNFWGTTLFYCDVQWGDSGQKHFDAYDANRDNQRCRSLCRWMISKEGWLYGYNQEAEIWELFQF